MYVPSAWISRVPYCPLTVSGEASGTAPVTAAVPATAPVIASVLPLGSLSALLPEPPRIAWPASTLFAVSSCRLLAGTSATAFGALLTSVIVARPLALALSVVPVVRVAVSVKVSLTSLSTSAVIGVRTST